MIDKESINKIKEMLKISNDSVVNAIKIYFVESGLINISGKGKTENYLGEIIREKLEEDKKVRNMWLDEINKKLTKLEELNSQLEKIEQSYEDAKTDEEKRKASEERIRIKKEIKQTELIKQIEEHRDKEFISDKQRKEWFEKVNKEQKNIIGNDRQLLNVLDNNIKRVQEENKKNVPLREKDRQDYIETGNKILEKFDGLYDTMKSTVGKSVTLLGIILRKPDIALMPVILGEILGPFRSTLQFMRKLTPAFITKWFDNLKMKIGDFTKNIIGHFWGFVTKSFEFPTFKKIGGFFGKEFKNLFLKVNNLWKKITDKDSFIGKTLGIILKVFTPFISVFSIIGSAGLLGILLLAWPVFRAIQGYIKSGWGGLLVGFAKGVIEEFIKMPIEIAKKVFQGVKWIFDMMGFDTKWMDTVVDGFDILIGLTNSIIDALSTLPIIKRSFEEMKRKAIIGRYEGKFKRELEKKGISTEGKTPLEIEQTMRKVDKNLAQQLSKEREKEIYEAVNKEELDKQRIAKERAVEAYSQTLDKQLKQKFIEYGISPDEFSKEKDRMLFEKEQKIKQFEESYDEYYTKEDIEIFFKKMPDKYAPNGIALRDIVRNLEGVKKGSKEEKDLRKLYETVGSPDYPSAPFQYGGIVNKPTNAVVGEAGMEAIIPLRNLPNDIGKKLQEILGSKDKEILTSLQNIAEAIKGMMGMQSAQRELENYKYSPLLAETRMLGLGLVETGG